jgi:hypothetical protein
MSFKSGKAQPTRKVPANTPVKVSVRPTQRTPPAVPPSHARTDRLYGSGVGHGVTPEARAAIKANTPPEAARKILSGY